MKAIRKALKITSVLILFLIFMAFLIPVIFKKQVQTLVKKEINKQLNAIIDFSDINLSIFRNFPKATISIKGLTIAGKDHFAKDTLIAARKINLTSDLLSVLKGKDIQVHAMYLQQPRINLLVNKLGQVNWDILKDKSDTTLSDDTTASVFRLSLKKYSISNGYLKYDDKKANTYLELDRINHSGSGNIMSDIYTLFTSTQIASFRLVQDSMPYINNVKTKLDAGIQIDNNTQTYRIKTDELQLNAMKLSLDGFLQISDSQTYKMDFKFSTPSNDFKNILSLVPAIYKSDFSKIKTSGEAILSGFVKGLYSTSQMPAYEVKILVKNGMFQYPELPKPVKNINLNIHLYNTDGKPDNAVVDIPDGHLEFDKEPFDFKLVYKKPVSIQYLEASVKGKLELSQLSQFIRLPSETKLHGLLWTDAFVKGPLKAIQQQSGPFSAGGFFNLRNLYYANKHFTEPIKNGNIKAVLSHDGENADNTVIDVAQGHVELGNNPIDFSLQVSKPLTTVNFMGRIKGKFTLNNIGQFVTFPQGTSLSGIINADLAFNGNKTALLKNEFDKINLAGHADFTNIHYTSKEYPEGIHISAFSLQFNSTNISVNNFNGNYLGTNITAAGTLNNLIGYLMKRQPVKGTVNLSADYMNLNQWTSTTNTNDENKNQEPSGPFIVPSDVDFSVNCSVNKVKYDNVEYENISGTLLIKDEMVKFENLKANALDGSCIINGSYSTKIDKQKPDINLDYDVKNVDVQKAFNAYNTVRFLAPVGKFLSGKLHSQLTLTGNMDSKMFIMLNSLSGRGNLLLLEGFLAKFTPLEKIAEVLDIEKLKSITVKDIKNSIEFANGKVLVKPFTITVKDIVMYINGFHGLDQTLDYFIKMKLPRSAMGAKGNNLVNNLIDKAKAQGINISNSETITLYLKITGTITNPSVTVNLDKTSNTIKEEMQEQVKEFAKVKIDSATQKTRDSLDAVKKIAEEKAKEKLAEIGIDTTNLNIKNAKDTIKQRVKDTLKKKLKNFLMRN